VGTEPGDDFEESLDSESNYVETVNISLVEQQLQNSAAVSLVRTAGLLLNSGPMSQVEARHPHLIILI
jgi:hypothetical protein